MPRHFLTGTELDSGELHALLDRAAELKAQPRSSSALEDRVVALIFEKPSTRTRLSFEAGVVELGGHPLVLRPGELQLERGESIRDTALVLSRQVQAVGVRTGPHEFVEELARHASIPVFNMLTESHHPCQVLADLMTVREAVGSLEGVTLAYVGDGNNVARSLALIGTAAGLDVVVSSPRGYELEPEAGGRRVADPREAVAGAQVVYTDVWVSMGDEKTADARRAALAPYRVDDALLDAAAPDADRSALPARPPGRGDHGGSPLRRSPAHLGPGREPPARPEGAARAAARVVAPVSGAACRRLTQPGDVIGVRASPEFGLSWWKRGHEPRRAGRRRRVVGEHRAAARDARRRPCARRGRCRACRSVPISGVATVQSPVSFGQLASDRQPGGVERREVQRAVPAIDLLAGRAVDVGDRRAGEELRGR